MRNLIKLLVPESVYSIQPLQNPCLPHFTYIQIDYSPLFKNREKILLNKMSHKCSGIHLLPTQDDCVGEIVHLNHTDACFILHSLVTHFRKSSWWRLSQITFIIGILFLAFLVDLLLQIKVKIIDVLPLCVCSTCDVKRSDVISICIGFSEDEGQNPFNPALY